MKKHFTIYVLLGLFMAMTGFTACNSDDDDNTFDTIDTSDQFACMIKSFSLQDNPKVLENLDTVFFSIDLNQGRIFNADSLPLGTRIDSLGVTMSFSSVSKAEIIMPGSSGQDTTINYLEGDGSKSAIDFSRGYVIVRVESANALAKRDYRVDINVHKMKPDSLAWGDASFSSYPTSLSAPTDLKAVEFEGKALCFATDGTRSTRGSSANPGLNDWQIVDVNIPSTLNLKTIMPSKEALYAIDGGVLAKSSDGGSTWVSTGAPMTHIFCTYENKVIGVNKRSDNTYVYVTYPASTEVAVPAGAPVSGTGAPLTFTTEWSDSPMVFVLGGCDASGKFNGDTWAYDGSQWSKVSANSISSVRDVTMFPYFSIKVSQDWKVTKKSALIAFGGRLENGLISRPTYFSSDLGVNWSKAGELMQLPQNVPSLTGAQALVFEQTLSSRAASAWSPLELPSIPGWLSVESNPEISPITSWDCPYIYLFGGVDEYGRLNTKVWRGVINRLSFKPLQ